MIGAILLQVILVGLNAIFSSAEIAVISMNDAKLDAMASEGNPCAKRIVRLTSNPAKFLATIQVAITLSGFLGSAYAADNFASPLVQTILTIHSGFDQGRLNSICVFVITLLISYFSIVFGELIPKRIAMQKMEMVAFGTSRLLSIVSVLFKPIVFLLTASTNAVLHLLHISTEDNEQVSEEEIRMILATSSSNGGIEAGENEMIQKVFDLNDIPIKDICTHRKEIIGLSMEDGLEDWKETIQNNHQSFYPVYGETIDEVYGVLDVKMYFRSDQSSMINVIDSAVRKPYFVPAGMKADDLLREMKKRGDFFACVIDEYGTFIGIVTLRDIMEIIVGDLIEKGEEKEEEIVKLSEETWLVRGTALLSEVERELKVNLHTKENGIFSGFLIRHLGRIPRDGEELDMVIGAMNIHINKIEDHVIESANVTVERK